MENKTFTQRIIIHKPEDFIKAFSQLNCGVKPFVQLNNAAFEISFSDVLPIEGYIEPKNKNTGQPFPACCDYHKDILKKSTEWFKKFPNCCDAHRNLLKAKWFDKKNYKNVPLKIVRQVSYTAYHIDTQIENLDWYKDITDYISYNVGSFGQLPAGYGNPIGLNLYFNNVKHKIKVSEIEENKSRLILEYLEGYEKPAQNDNQPDLNILHLTYQKWLNLFPFGISYFRDLKSQFSKKMPFISGKPEYNKYTGMSSATIQTQAGLITALTNRTIQLLQKINSEELIKQNLIADTDQHRLELINESHRIKQRSLLGEFSKGEMKYVKILEQWLGNEKKYIIEIEPLIKSEQYKSQMATPESRSEFSWGINDFSHNSGSNISNVYAGNGGINNFRFNKGDNISNVQSGEFKNGNPFNPKKNTSSKQDDVEKPNNSTMVKPKFRAEAMAEIFDTLKVYFNEDQYVELKNILQSGGQSEKKLIFHSSAASLCDFFKQLYRGQFLIIGVQAHFEAWLADNFCYIDNKGKPAILTPKYASRFISENKRAAKGNQLIDIKRNENGTFKIVSLELKSRRQNRNMEEKRK